MDIHSQEFLIEQTDKMVAFQTVLEKLLRSNRVKEGVFKMAKNFAMRAKTKQNVRTYQNLEKQIKQLAKGSALKVGRKKCRCMRNPGMTLCG